MLAVLIYLKVLFIKTQLKIEVVSKRPKPAKVLVLFLSVLKDNLVRTIKDSLNNNNFLREDLEKTPWEMPLTAIEYHKEQLQTVFVITSSGNDGSYNCLPLFKNIIDFLYPNIKVNEGTPSGINFEDIIQTFKAINEMFVKIAGLNYKEKDVIIDSCARKKISICKY